MKKRILITGSNGLLGQKLVELLLSKPEVDFLATSRGENKLAELYPQVKFRQMDITNAEDINRVFEEYQPTHVINTAAETNVDICETEREAAFLMNAKSVEYLVKACKKRDTHLIHVSTDFIFDGENGPYSEEAEPNPVNYYGETKLAAEKLVMESDIKWAIARTVLVIGTAHDYGRSNIILWVKNSLEAGKPINVVNDQFRTPTLAEDLAMGCWLIAEKDATGVFNISGEELLTPHQMAMQVVDYFKLPGSLITETDGSKFVQPAKRPPKTGFIIEKAKKQLDYKPHTFKEAIDVIAGQLK